MLVSCFECSSGRTDNFMALHIVYDQSIGWVWWFIESYRRYCSCCIFTTGNPQLSQLKYFHRNLSRCARRMFNVFEGKFLSHTIDKHCRKNWTRETLTCTNILNCNLIFALALDTKSWEFDPFVNEWFFKKLFLLNALAHTNTLLDWKDFLIRKACTHEWSLDLLLR